MPGLIAQVVQPPGGDLLHVRIHHHGDQATTTAATTTTTTMHHNPYPSTTLCAPPSVHHHQRFLTPGTTATTTITLLSLLSPSLHHLSHLVTSMALSKYSPARHSAPSFYIRRFLETPLHPFLMPPPIKTLTITIIIIMTSNPWHPKFPPFYIGKIVPVSRI